MLFTHTLIQFHSDSIKYNWKGLLFFSLVNEIWFLHNFAEIRSLTECFKMGLLTWKTRNKPCLFRKLRQKMYWMRKGPRYWKMRFWMVLCLSPWIRYLNGCYWFFFFSCQLFSFTFYFILFCLYLFHILKVCGKRVVKKYNNTSNSGTNKWHVFTMRTGICNNAFE